jgi:hypothetical protein
MNQPGIPAIKKIITTIVDCRLPARRYGEQGKTKLLPTI